LAIPVIPKAFIPQFAVLLYAECRFCTESAVEMTASQMGGILRSLSGIRKLVKMIA